MFPNVSFIIFNVLNILLFGKDALLMFLKIYFGFNDRINYARELSDGRVIRIVRFIHQKLFFSDIICAMTLMGCDPQFF